MSVKNYDGNISYEYIYMPNEGGIEIVQYFGTDKDIIIPTEINGKSVNSIGHRTFYNDTGLTSVIIPNSVTNIGEYAFCSNKLTSVVIPNSVTNIGEYAFTSQSNTTGNGKIYGPQTLKDTYYNSTYFDTAKLTEWIVQ